jgi:hypothetical protein
MTDTQRFILIGDIVLLSFTILVGAVMLLGCCLAAPKEPDKKP